MSQAPIEDALDFREYKLQVLEYLICTKPGIEESVRRHLLLVINAETYLEIETSGE